MSTQTLEDFTAKTHADLTRLSAEAATIWARMPQHKPCGDKAPCRHCADIKAIHARINDHLDQLESAS